MKGVSWYSKYNKWCASRTVEGTRKFLGYHPTRGSAENAIYEDLMREAKNGCLTITTFKRMGQARTVRKVDVDRAEILVKRGWLKPVSVHKANDFTTVYKYEVLRCKN